MTSRDESKPLPHASDCRCNLCIGAAGSPFPSEPVRIQRPPMAGGTPPDLSSVKQTSSDQTYSDQWATARGFRVLPCSNAARCWVEVECPDRIVQMTVNEALRFSDFLRSVARNAGDRRS